MDSDKFDAPLLGILQSCGELEPFLEVVLGFLYRKTDFFRPLSSDQSMGFAPGVAREKLLKVFKKYERQGNPGTVPRSPPSCNNHPPTPPATPGLPTSTAPKPAPAAAPEPMEQIQGDWSTSNWDHHNGGVTEHYAWSQTAQDVELKLALPNPNIKASDLKIDIKPYNLKVQLKQENSDLQTLLEEKLHSLVKPEESMWSLHKENKPNVPAVVKKEEQPSSPRWNQKFSSLVPRKKSSPRDKPQRVRGPAIQWSAETLFNTADEAKAFITRDNKWKFRYSHQTTEGKKVYYQCTQRAKLGCGSLCHVVYHHVGTALLYTNGEPHNHIEYNSILSNNTAPTNVAISNLNVQNQVALLQKIVSSASSSISSSISSSLSPKPTSTATSTSPKVVTSSPSQLSPRPREDWTPVTIFQSRADAKTFIEHEGLWKFAYSHATPLGKKINLEKGRDGYWWTGMFEGGESIDLSGIDTTRYMHEFGNEERACVQKLMFDQQQKMKGEPSSDELATEEILKKAWNAEGSPFAGTEYERGKVNLSNTFPPEPPAGSSSGKT